MQERGDFVFSEVFLVPHVRKCLVKDGGVPDKTKLSFCGTKFFLIIKSHILKSTRYDRCVLKRKRKKE